MITTGARGVEEEEVVEGGDRVGLILFLEYQEGEGEGKRGGSHPQTWRRRWQRECAVELQMQGWRKMEALCLAQRRARAR